MISLPIVVKIAIGAMVLGATAGAVGAFAVLRRRSLMGDMLAHAALPGICLAYLAFQTRELWALSTGALLTGLVGVLAVLVVCRWTRIREDAAMSIVLSTFFGAGVVLLTVIQRRPDGNQAGLDAYLFGEIASLQWNDIQLLLVVGVVVFALLSLLYKELKLSSFDHDFAQSQGWPAIAIDFGVMAAVSVVTVVGLPICGVVLMAAMLIFPCASARYWSNRLSGVVLGSIFIGAMAAGIGVLIASPHYAERFFLTALLHTNSASPPPGPLIVLSGAMIFLASMLFAPRWGLIVRSWRQINLRQAIACDHILRLLYEMTEKSLPDRSSVSVSQLVARMSAGSATRSWGLSKTVRSGYVERPTYDTLRLTSAGLTAAARVTRVHRLWEQFLIRHADIASDHVHRPADDIEHLLPESMVKRLEEDLASEDRLPAISAMPAVPPSPHELEG